MNRRGHCLTVSVCVALAWLMAVAGEPARAQTAGAAATATGILVPPMFGDWIDPSIDPFKGTRLQPLATTYSAFKVAENESPLPMDRLLVTYNFYSRVLGTQDVHRETLGVEKIFLGGHASLGLRLPFWQIRSDGGPDAAKVDDLSLIFKYAVFRADAGALSSGLAVSLPTGPSYQPAVGRDRTIAQLQPFVGYLWRQGEFFLHGFLSVDVPTDAVAPTVLFNDLGVGYRLAVGGGEILRAVIPTVEVHVNSPLSHRSASDPERRRDSVHLTVGAHLELGERTWLSFAAATPVTRPRLFDAEALARLNWRF